MNELEEAIGRVNDFRKFSFFNDIFRDFKAIGNLQRQLTIEAENESRNPTVKGAFNSGYVNGVFFAKKQLLGAVFPLHKDILNVLTETWQCPFELESEMNDVICKYENIEEYTLANLYSELNAVVKNHFNSTKTK
ncbi:hypothetical protein [Priestia aryabhattai]